MFYCSSNVSPMLDTPRQLVYSYIEGFAQREVGIGVGGLAIFWENQRLGGGEGGEVMECFPILEFVLTSRFHNHR